VRTLPLEQCEAWARARQVQNRDIAACIEAVFDTEEFLAWQAKVEAALATDDPTAE
jgi:hypothetical protein